MSSDKFNIDFLFFKVINLPHEINNKRNTDCLRKVFNWVLHENHNYLTDKQRNILYLHYVEGKNVLEISKDLGLDPSTVSRTKTRAIDNLKFVMEIANKTISCFD